MMHVLKYFVAFCLLISYTGTSLAGPSGVAAPKFTHGSADMAAATLAPFLAGQVPYDPTSARQHEVVVTGGKIWNPATVLMMLPLGIIFQTAGGQDGVRLVGLVVSPLLFLIGFVWLMRVGEEKKWAPWVLTVLGGIMTIAFVSEVAPFMKIYWRGGLSLLIVITGIARGIKKQWLVSLFSGVVLAFIWHETTLIVLNAAWAMLQEIYYFWSGLLSVWWHAVGTLFIEKKADPALIIVGSLMTVLGGLSLIDYGTKGSKTGPNQMGSSARSVLLRQFSVTSPEKVSGPFEWFMSRFRKWHHAENSAASDVRMSVTDPAGDARAQHVFSQTAEMMLFLAA